MVLNIALFQPPTFRRSGSATSDQTPKALTSRETQNHGAQSPRIAEGRNANHPFFRLPAEFGNDICARSQHHPAQHEVVTLHFGSERPFLAGFTGQVSLLHVCRRFRQELLPFIVKSRRLTLLYDGFVSTFIPPSISTLPTDILHMIHLQDGNYNVDIRIGANWEKCDQPKLLAFLGNSLENLDGELEKALGSGAMDMGDVTIHVTENGRYTTMKPVYEGDDIPETGGELILAEKMAFLALAIRVLRLMMVLA